MNESREILTLYNEFRELVTIFKNEKYNYSVADQCKVKEVKEVLIKRTKACQDKLPVWKMKALIAYINLDYAKLPFLSNIEKENIALSTLNLLKDYASRDEIVYVFLKIVNFVAFLFMSQERFTETLTILEEAEGLGSYCNLELRGNLLCQPEDLIRCFVKHSSNSKIVLKVFKTITNNLQIQAYIYFKLGKWNKFEVYENNVLQRQLETSYENPVKWSKKTMSLAAHFLTKGKFL